MPLTRYLPEKVAHLLVDESIQPFHLTVRLWSVSCNRKPAHTHDTQQGVQHLVQESRVIIGHKSLGKSVTTDPLRKEDMSYVNSVCGQQWMQLAPARSSVNNDKDVPVPVAREEWPNNIERNTIKRALDIERDHVADLRANFRLG